MASAEQAYLFRHALLRDAAYDLHLPGVREQLHAVALGLIEAVYNGRPADSEIEPGQVGDMPRHPLDDMASELARHARIGRRHDPALQPALELYLHRAAEHAARQLDNERAAAHWAELAELREGSQRGHCRWRAADYLMLAARANAGLGLLKGALEDLQPGDNRLLRGALHSSLARGYIDLGRLDDSEAAQQQALAIFRELGAHRQEGSAMANLAHVYFSSGRWEEAEATVTRAISIHRELGDRRAEGVGLSNLANLYQYTKRFDEAAKTYDDALEIHRQTGNRRSEGITLGNVGNLLRELERPADAETAYQQALGIHREVGNRRSEGVVLSNLASLCADADRLQEAEELYRQAVAIHVEIGNRTSLAEHELQYAICLLKLGRRDEAEQSWQRGRDMMLNELANVRVYKQLEDFMVRLCGKLAVPVLGEDRP